MSMRTYTKDPSAVLDYTWDWQSWLATGETIATADVITPTGLTEDSVTTDTESVTVWLSGGTEGESHLVVCEITTTDGRTDQRSLRILVRER